MILLDYEEREVYHALNRVGIVQQIDYNMKGKELMVWVVYGDTNKLMVSLVDYPK